MGNLKSLYFSSLRFGFSLSAEDFCSNANNTGFGLTFLAFWYENETVTQSWTKGDGNCVIL